MKRFLTGCTVALALTATGCAGSSPELDPASSVVQSSVTPTPSPEPTEPERITSARGNLVKAVGQSAGYANAGGETLVEFKVTEILTNFTCTSPYAEPSDNGHFIALRFEIATTPAYEDIGAFSGYGWKMISTDGTTFNHELSSMPAGMCLADVDALPNDIGPGENVSGLVVIDAPATEGTIIVNGFDGGWEYVLSGPSA